MRRRSGGAPRAQAASIAGTPTDQSRRGPLSVAIPNQTNLNYNNSAHLSFDQLRTGYLKRRRRPTASDDEVLEVVRHRGAGESALAEPPPSPVAVEVLLGTPTLDAAAAAVDVSRAPMTAAGTSREDRMFLDPVRDRDLTSDDAYCIYKSLLSIPVADKPLPPSIFKALCKKLSLLSEAYLQHPTPYNLISILGVQSVGIAPGLTHYKSALVVSRLKAYPAVQLPPQARQEAGDNKNRWDSTPSRASGLVRKGLLRRAYRLLSSPTGISPGDADTIRQLQDLHPAGPMAPFPSQIRHKCAVVTREAVQEAIATCPWDTSAGPSGFTPAFCKAMTKKNVCAAFLDFLVFLSKQIAEGTAPCFHVLCATKLVPLIKTGGGVRPIAVGEMFYRVAGKAILGVSRVTNDLARFQFGVGANGGAEPMIAAVERGVQSLGGHGTVYSLDLKNAFNTIDRKCLVEGLRKHNPKLLRFAQWAYGRQTECLVRTDDGNVACVVSSQGVRQGDPLGPYFFSLAFRTTLEKLNDEVTLRNGKMWAYLDDVFCVIPRGNTGAVHRSFLNVCTDILEQSGVGLTLNESKCKETVVGAIDRNGLEILGTILGGVAVRREFLERKVCDMEKGIRACLALPLQHRLLLLRSCSSTTLLHLLRSLDSEGLDDCWKQAQRVLLDEIGGLAGVGQLDEHASILATLPVRLGGLGVPNYLGVGAVARESYLSLARVVLDGDPPPDTTQRIRSSRVHDLNSECLLTLLSPRERLTVVDNSSKLGSAWLGMLPLFTSRILSDRQITSAVRCRLLVSGPARPCPACTLPLDFLHQECCQSGRQSTAQRRHDTVCASFVRAGKANLQRMSVEPASSPGTGPHTRADFRIQGPKASNGISCTYDVSFISLTGSNAEKVAQSCRKRPKETWRAFTSRQIDAVIKSRVASKEAKFGSMFADLFVPLVFTCGGSTSEHGRTLIKNLRGGEIQLPFDVSIACLAARASQVQ
jgi:hypothetical protein